MTEQQYFGWFSGEDYPTFEDWRKSHREAMKQDNLFMVMDAFAPYIENWTFFDMLYPAQMEYVLARMKHVIGLVEWRMANSASETK